MVHVSQVGGGTGTRTKEAVTDAIRGTGTRITGAGDAAWVYDLPRSITISSGVEVTQSIYVENIGANPFRLAFVFGTGSHGIDIPVGFKGVVSDSAVLTEDSAPHTSVYTINGKPMRANFYSYMVNYGSEPKPWIKAGADASSPCVGAMTDYRSGKLFDTRQVVLPYYITTNLDLTGERRYSRMYYSVGADPAKKNRFYTNILGGGAGSVTTASGGRFSEDDYNRLMNPDGAVYGWMEYENKLPKDVSPNCGVLLRWLNSRGFIDSMFFEKYSIKPVMRTNNSGGNGIDYYETTLQIDVNWDNEPCLNWIQRSSDIIARIPIDICQFGKATLLATNVFQMQGGNKTKTIQFKFKVQIVEP
jgi:hypothetical protein